ncbi:MAG: winged helix-turn-helix domain-containing protein [Cyanobacteria bacterium P01_E01_bin.42]
MENIVGWEYLKKCGYSWQRPRPKHRKGDKKAQEEFKVDLSELVKKLKKQYPNAEIEVWCLGWLDMARKPRRLPTASLMNIEWD